MGGWDIESNLVYILDATINQCERKTILARVRFDIFR